MGMAPWLSRHGLHQANAVTPRTRLYDALLDPTAPLSGLPVHDGLARGGDPSSSESESDIHPPRPGDRPRRPQRPQHSRSMSHPFPYLFSSRKKKQGGHGEDSLSDSESEFGSSGGTSISRSQTTSHGAPRRNGHGRFGNLDFTNGNCMTCGCMVRWPRDLQLFRCTVCLTINDLAPRTSEERSDRMGRTPSHADSPNDNAAQLVRYISTPHTRQIIRQCLSAFLGRSFRGTNKGEDDAGAIRREATAASYNVANDTASALVSRTPGGTQLWAPRKQTTSIHASGHESERHPSLASTSLRVSSSFRSYSSSYPERPSMHSMMGQGGQRPSKDDNPIEQDTRRIFKPLEDYIISCFNSLDCINSSFSTRPQPAVSARAGNESRTRQPIHSRREAAPGEPNICDVDPKLLLLGDFAENGSWWTGGQEDARPPRASTRGRNNSISRVTLRSPQIDWGELRNWYMLVINAAESWRSVYDAQISEQIRDGVSIQRLRHIEARLLAGQQHAQGVLLKATEMLLKRPGRLISDPGDLRSLLITLHNPLLNADARQFQGTLQRRPSAAELHHSGRRGNTTATAATAAKAAALPQAGMAPIFGNHSGIVKRILGLMSNSSVDCRSHLVNWLAHMGTGHFREIKALVDGFLTHRLLRDNETRRDAREARIDMTAGLIPSMDVGGSVASLHSEIGRQMQPKAWLGPPKKLVYHEDWQIRVASAIMGLLFKANNLAEPRRDMNTHLAIAGENGHQTTKESIHAQGQILPTSDFYSSLIGRTDLVADFEAWEAKRGRFAFCQYPFLLSISAKTKILEHEAKRQMMSKARDAFFDSIMTRKNINQYLMLHVRRECLVEDSLKTVSEIVGSGSEDIQKRLRIVFAGEEGVDHGGLRKEWFLLLVREVFNPDHGMFIYDEDSQYCYFNPNSFETSDQFFLVGVVMGLAIYNSTILDVPLPPFAFRKLVASGPAPSPGSAAHPRPVMTYTLGDLAEYRPRLARGLSQLLEYDGDVEEVFSLDFVVHTDRYGTTSQVPLCPGGERKPVKNSNRREYVDLYVRYLLDTAVSRQFEPFKRGFYTICSGNALSLFRPEEIELLIRGSDEALDIAPLRAVAEYENWATNSPDGSELVIEWFWATFEKAAPSDQRKLLLFITGSDRIPATGASNLHVKITCLGDDCGRYPIARTCFNTLALWRYGTREKLELMLWTAVSESEGFGLK